MLEAAIKLMSNGANAGGTGNNTEERVTPLFLSMLSRLNKIMGMKIN